MKEENYNVDKNGIRIYDKPCEEMWEFEFDDTFVELNNKEDEAVSDGRETES